MCCTNWGPICIKLVQHRALTPIEELHCEQIYKGEKTKSPIGCFIIQYSCLPPCGKDDLDWLFGWGTPLDHLVEPDLGVRNEGFRLYAVWIWWSGGCVRRGGAVPEHAMLKALQNATLSSSLIELSKTLNTRTLSRISKTPWKQIAEIWPQYEMGHPHSLKMEN